MMSNIRNINENLLILYSKIFSILWAVFMTFDIITTQIDLRIGQGLHEGNPIMVQIVKYPVFELIAKYLIVLVVFFAFSCAVNTYPKNIRTYCWLVYIFGMIFLCVHFGYLVVNNILFGFSKYG